MSEHLATIVYIAGIAGLFYLDRDPDRKVSWAIWIPTLWLLIIGSRSVSEWFQSGPQVSRMTQYTEGSPLDAAIFGILIAGGVVVLSRRSGKVRQFLGANWPLLAYFGWCALSVLWSGYPSIAAKRWVKATGDVIMVLVVLTDPEPALALKKLLSRAAFILLPVSVLFIKYYPDLGRVYDPWTWQPLYTGVTTFKNLLGMTCLLCGLGSLWSFSSAWHYREMPYRWRHMAAHGASLFFTTYLLHTANSMTSISCLVLAGTILVSTMQQKAAPRARMARLLIFGCVAFALMGLFGDPRTMLKSVGRDPTLTGRTIIWHAVLSLHSNPIIGEGFESFWMGPRLQAVTDLTGGQHLQEAHNGYLEVYLNLGWIGVALLVNLIVHGYRSSMASFRRAPQFGRVRIALFTAGVIYSFTEAGFRMLSVAWFGFLLAAIAVPWFPERQAGNLRLSRASRQPRRVEAREAVSVLQAPVAMAGQTNSPRKQFPWA